VLDISNLEQDLDTAYFSEDNKVLFATPSNNVNHHQASHITKLVKNA
jgi:hypothetical protein